MALTNQELKDFSKKIYDSFSDIKDSASAQDNLEIKEKFDDDKVNRNIFHKTNEEILSIHQELYSTWGELRSNISDTLPYKYFGLSIPDVNGYHKLPLNIAYTIAINNDKYSVILGEGQDQWAELITALNELTTTFSENKTITTVDGGANSITISGASFNNSYINKFVIKDSTTAINKYVHRIISASSDTLVLESAANLSPGDSITIFMDKKYEFSYDAATEDIKVVMGLSETYSDYQVPTVMLKQEGSEYDLFTVLKSDLTKDIYNWDDTSDLWIYGAKLTPQDPDLNTPFNIFHKELNKTSTAAVKTPKEMLVSNGQFYGESDVGTYLYPRIGERERVVLLDIYIDHLTTATSISATTPINLTKTTYGTLAEVVYQITNAGFTGDITNNSYCFATNGGSSTEFVKILEVLVKDNNPLPDDYYIKFDILPEGFEPTSLTGNRAAFLEADAKNISNTDQQLQCLKGLIINSITDLKNDYLYIKNAILRSLKAFDSDNANYLVSIYQAYLTLLKWCEKPNTITDERFEYDYFTNLLALVTTRNALLDNRRTYLSAGNEGFGILGLARISGDTGKTSNESKFIASQIDAGTLTEEQPGGDIGTGESSYLTVELLRKELLAAQNETNFLKSDAELNNVNTATIDDYEASYGSFTFYLTEVLSDPFSFAQEDSPEFQDIFTDYLEKRRTLISETAFKSKTIEESTKLETLEVEQERALNSYLESVNSQFLSDEIKVVLQEEYLAYNSKLNELTITGINGNIVTFAGETFDNSFVNKLILKPSVSIKSVTVASGTDLTLNDVIGLSINDVVELHAATLGTSNALKEKLETVMASGVLTSEVRAEIAGLSVANSSQTTTLTSANQSAVNDIFRNLQVADEVLEPNSQVNYPGGDIPGEDVIITQLDSSINVSIKLIGRDVQIFFNYANKVYPAQPTYYVYGYQIQGRTKVWTDEETTYDEPNAWYPLKNNDYNSYESNTGGLDITVETGGLNMATTSLTPFLMHRHLPISGSLLFPKNRTVYYRFRKIIKNTTNETIVGYSSWSNSNYEAVIYPDQTGITGDTWIKLNDHDAPVITGMNLSLSPNVLETFTTHYVDVDFTKCPENANNQVGTKGYNIYRAETRSGAPGSYTYPDKVLVDILLEDKPYETDYSTWPSAEAEYTYIDTSTSNDKTYYYGIAAYDYNENYSEIVWSTTPTVTNNTVKADIPEITEVIMYLADIKTIGYFQIYFTIPVIKKVGIKSFNIKSKFGSTTFATNTINFEQCIFVSSDGTDAVYYYNSSSYYTTYPNDWWKEYDYFKTGSNSTCLNFSLQPISIFDTTGDYSTASTNAMLTEGIAGFTYEISFDEITPTVIATRGKFVISWNEAITRGFDKYVVYRKKFDELEFYALSYTDSLIYNDSLLYLVDAEDPEITDIKYKIIAYNLYGKSKTSGTNYNVGTTGFVDFRPQAITNITFAQTGHQPVEYIDDRIELRFDNSTATDIATLEVEKYKIYFSQYSNGTKYFISQAFFIDNISGTGDVAKFPSLNDTSIADNLVVLYQNWNKMLGISEDSGIPGDEFDIADIYFWIKSVTSNGAESNFQVLTPKQADANYTNDIIDAIPTATTLVSATRDFITVSWNIPNMFTHTDNIQFIIEHCPDTTVGSPVWTQLFTTASKEITYSYKTPERYKTPEDFDEEGWRVKTLLRGKTSDYLTSSGSNTNFTGFLSYYLDSVEITNISYEREKVIFTFEQITGANLDDIKELVIYRRPDPGNDYIEFYRGLVDLIKNAANLNIYEIACPEFRGLEVLSIPDYAYKISIISKYSSIFDGNNGTDYNVITTTDYVKYALTENITGLTGYLSRSGIIINFNKYEDNAGAVIANHNESDVKGYILKRKILSDSYKEIANIKETGSSSYEELTNIPIGKQASYFQTSPGYSFKIQAYSDFSISPEVEMLYSSTNFTVDPDYSFTPDTNNLSAPYVYGENSSIYIEMALNYDFYDEYDFLVYQSKTYNSGSPNGTVGTITDTSVVVSNATGISNGKRLLINNNTYKVMNVSGTTITLEDTIEITNGASFWIFDLIGSTREELYKIPILESGDSNYFKNWSHLYEVKTIYGFRKASGVTTGVVITNWSSNINYTLPSDNNLLAYWNMDNVSNNILIDNSGNNWNGTVSGTGTISTAGKINNGLSFNGSGYVSIGDLESVGPFSYCVWIKYTASGSIQSIISKDNNTNRGIWMYAAATTGNLYFYTSGDGTNQIGVTISGYSDNNWHFIVATYTPSTSIKIYADGILKSTNTTSIPASQFLNSTTLEIARRPNATAYYTGLIDEIRIYNIALTDSEVMGLYKYVESSNKLVSNLNKYVSISIVGGSLFKYRESGNKTLIANVYEEGINITSSIDATKFRWKRVSSSSTADTTWNTAANLVGSKTATINSLDYYSRGAIYSVEIMD